MVSLEAIFLSTFILISQNHDTKICERRNHLDLQINLLSEQENTQVIIMLQAIAAKVGARIDQYPHLRALSEETRLPLIMAICDCIVAVLDAYVRRL